MIEITITGSFEAHKLALLAFNISRKSDFMTLNPVRGVSAVRLKKVKVRLKDFYRGIAEFTHKMAEVHGNRTHLMKMRHP